MHGRKNQLFLKDLC